MKGYKVSYATRYFLEDEYLKDFYTINEDILKVRVKSMFDKLLKISSDISDNDFNNEIDKLKEELQYEHNNAEFLELKKPYFALKIKDNFGTRIIVQVYELYEDEYDDYSQVCNKAIIIEEIEIH